MVTWLQAKCTELYRNVPISVHRYMVNVPKNVPKRTETYRNVPKQTPPVVPKRTERVYNPFGFGTKRVSVHSVFGIGCFGLVLDFGLKGWWPHD